MSKAISYAAHTANKPLSPFTFERREVGVDDVKIEILYCGVCHSDIHIARNEWNHSVFPVVPGHEIVGRVVALGKNVMDLKVGQTVGVGCLVDSCGTCPECNDNVEQYCNSAIFTFNSADRHSQGVTYGGYSDHIVTDKKFVLTISDKLDLAAAAPLLCAGITTYSPLKKWKVKKGDKVGIVGLGGLGHMGVKFAKAMGAYVVLFTTSEEKAKDAKRLGADQVVISKDEKQMKAHLQSFDFIINTVAAPHNLDNYSELLKRDGTLCLLGIPDQPHPSPNIGNLVFKRRNISGSLIGGIKETQEMLDFCAEHNIVSDIELIPMSKINEAYDRMLASDIKYRFVIDMSTLKE